MDPNYNDHHITLYNKSCLDMSELKDNSIQCVVTSPPYWGLRKYSGEQELIWGGDKDCAHAWGRTVKGKEYGRHDTNDPTSTNFGGWANWDGGTGNQAGCFCQLCGAWRGAYGLEPSPELYVQHTIEILREIRRVLRKDGVVFWNIGDSYKGQSGQTMSAEVQQKRHENGENINQAQHQMGMSTRPQDGKHQNLKPKDLCLIPFRIAIAAQEDGWWFRSDIIWSKPNPMPESVTDRPTNSHEYILMLTKSAKYYWDMDAVREEYTAPMNRWGGDNLVANGDSMWDQGTGQSTYRDRNMRPNSAGRNIRTVWEFPTQPYPEAHFAVFPEKLPETCIKAATPEVGCCSECGSPWERVTENRRGFTNGVCNHCGETENKHKRYGMLKVRQLLLDPTGDSRGRVQSAKSALFSVGVGEPLPCGNPITTGWQPTCKCNADKVPSKVLDPFSGAGTTLWVAKKLNRKAVGYELSEEYCKLIVGRNRQQSFSP